MHDLAAEHIAALNILNTTDSVLPSNQQSLFCLKTAVLCDCGDRCGDMGLPSIENDKFLKWWFDVFPENIVRTIDSFLLGQV